MRSFASSVVVLVICANARSACAQNAPPTQGTQPPAQSADAVAEARAHFDRGVSLFDAGDFAGALAEFNRAYEQSHRPNVLFNISATYQALHRYPEAAAALRQYLNLPDGARLPRRAEAEQALREVTALIAHLRITVHPGNAVITVDGSVVHAGDDVALGPGQHQVRAEIPGFHTALQDVPLTAGETREISLELVPGSMPAPGPIAQPPGGLAGFVVRGAPQGTTVMVDGQNYPADGALTLGPGTHRIAVRANGMQPWEGDIPLVAGQTGTLRVTLASAQRGLDPAYGGASLAVTVLLAAGAAVTGVLALETHAEFSQRTQSDPEAASLADRGRALSITADALGVATVLGAGLTAYFFARADFGPKHSNVELGLSPVPGGGAWAGIGARF